MPGVIIMRSIRQVLSLRPTNAPRTSMWFSD